MTSAQAMPVVFIGHGSPMNAIEDTPFHASWAALGHALPRPRAVLCISAHWETRGVYLTGASHPETIHDFYGFPRELFAVQYPAAGDPALAREVSRLLDDPHVHIDEGRGFDHGMWSVLRVMYPEAEVPTIQLSLDISRDGSAHYALARKLAPLREQGVLVLASGNIVHNLQLFHFHSREPLPWALRFRDQANALIRQREHAALCNFHLLGPDAELAINTAEHYLPLLYALALQRDDDDIRVFNDEVFSAMSMTSLAIGSSLALKNVAA
ncbi:4,5-DOPA dioxygenase extradiol [Dyella sp. C9]|uniref:4,5-DOPA-extradiol-dioxygenase n=1 Tax=Dyella sp. C9 TaxID=2202154 RepID=UPI000DF017C5|nr:4,5-DOPA dioxygenase extradiol [Dyella sp. C9]